MIMGTLGFPLVAAFLATGAMAAIAIVAFVRAERSFRRDPAVGAGTAAMLERAHLIAVPTCEGQQVATAAT
jgi:hypothetical protein